MVTMPRYVSDISKMIDVVWKIAVLLVFLYLVFGELLPLAQHFLGT